MCLFILKHTIKLLHGGWTVPTFRSQIKFVSRDAYVSLWQDINKVTVQQDLPWGHGSPFLHRPQWVWYPWWCWWMEQASVFRRQELAKSVTVCFTASPDDTAGPSQNTLWSVFLTGLMDSEVCPWETASHDRCGTTGCGLPCHLTTERSRVLSPCGKRALDPWASGLWAPDWSVQTS